MKYSPKQTKFIRAVLSESYQYLAYGGGIVGGKSYVTMGVLIMLALKYPGSRWAIVRKDLPTIRRNVIPTFERLRPPDFVGALNQSTWSYRCTNGSEILLFAESIQEDPELNRWKGLNVNGFLMDEGNECSIKSWSKAIERAGSWLVPGDAPQPKPLILVTFNPNSDWPRQVFYEPFMAGTLQAPYFYQPATIFDNPHAPADYVESLKNLPPAEYNRYVLGQWDIEVKPNQLIDPQWVWAARTGPVLPRTGWRLGCDIAREGDDSTVFCLMNGDNVFDFKDYQKLTTDVSADYIALYAADTAHPIDAPNIRVDAVGVGAGTYDALRRNGLNVTAVLGGAAPFERKGSIFKFNNLRSQMFWELAEKLRTGKLALPEHIPERLVSDLTALTRTIKGDKVIEVTPKNDLKRLIGRSPDWADALAYAAFDFPTQRAPRAPVISVAMGSPFAEG